ncbi:hypothetical protein [Anatilimnocola floriformis]|uniref:hypothetical protein n=1 Tax=Anatilimnocola floriformis TaxID=2948575 RepID=UPI0020C3F827|nr:hypothetical protein [Anatilimnocola floriformis]
MQLYLVPCHCGQQVRVRPSQAGEQLTCQCGATVSVPTIRGLKQLKTVDDEQVQTAPAAPMWQGPAFAIGLLALFAGAIVLAANAIYVPAELAYQPQHLGLTEEDIKRAEVPVADLGIDDLYKEFRALATHGRNENSEYLASQADQARRSVRQRQTTGLALTAMGVLLTIAGLAPLLVGRTSSPARAAK